jgi:GT2 family glycosyltransferase
MKTTAVCIVNYNTRDLLRDCLRSVLAEAPTEIIVVDNASTDHSAEIVTAEFPAAKLIRLEKNIGYGAASNMAVKSCYADYILLLNSDTVIKPGALRALSRYLEAQKLAAVVGPRILNPDGTPQTSCFHFPSPLHIFLYLSGLYRWIPRTPLLKKRSLQARAQDSSRVVPWVLGAALAFRRLTFESVGGFDESFFMYFEEVDLCQRLAYKGQQVHFAPDAEVIHVGGASTEQARTAMNLEYFASLEMFYRKHYPRLLLSQLVLIVKLFAFLHLMRDALRLPMTRNAIKKSHLRTNLIMHQDLLYGRWQKGASRGAILPA